ncbi:MAG: KGK family protein [Leptolyngbyaceae cyanobacterium SL_5_14]|nr:KGK family protein [Leptolyngbyaceae cyanobacterium SL_5_14]
MTEKFEKRNCGNDDVLAFGDSTYKVGKFKKAVDLSFSSSLGSHLSGELRNKGIQIDQKHLAPNNKPDEYARWFGSGIECEILQVGSDSWKVGKVRIKIEVEFYVEELESLEEDESDISETVQLESPLDSIRQMIVENDQE